MWLEELILLFFYLLVVCYRYYSMMYNFCHSPELNQLLEHLILMYFTKQFKIIEAINVF